MSKLAPLPIDAALPEIVAKLREHKALILTAAPGAGKSTRVPPALLAAGLTDKRWVMLQPRRVAARAVARRIAEEQEWRLGGPVGYQVRFEDVSSRETKLKVVTEGILSRQFQSDPFLENIGGVILDEFHERSIHSDIALGLLRELRESVRPDLYIVVMSATLEADPVSEYLGGAPCMQVEGRPYPVDLHFRPMPLQRERRGPPPLAAHMATVVREAAEQAQSKDILAFLPGMGEIRRLEDELQSWATRTGTLLLPLHGSLSAEEQDRALNPQRQRKVILATNIAETSLTIDGVNVVVDSGQVRRLRADPRWGVERLELGMVSRHSATQRMGRAGRQGPGLCYRLWSQFEDRELEESEVPEIFRVELSGVLLLLAKLGVRDFAKWQYFSAPPAAQIAAAERLLRALGALTTDNRLTPIGERMQYFALPPRLARLMLEAEARGLLRTGAGLAALLSEKDIFLGRTPARVASECDLSLRLDALEEGRSEEDLDRSAVRNARRVRDQLSGDRPDARAASENDVMELLLLAYPDRVCRRRSKGAPQALMVGGRGVALSERSGVQQAELFVALDLRDPDRGGSESVVAQASAVSVESLRKLFPERVKEKLRAEFDEAKGSVSATRALCFEDLPLEAAKPAQADAQQLSDLLAEALGSEPALFVWSFDETKSWRERVEFLRKHMPDLQWPNLGEQELRELVAEACMGKRKRSDISAGDLLSLLDMRLNSAQRQTLAREAPEAIEVPSGSRIRLRYEADQGVVLSVRLQELFGLLESPRLAGGRVMLTVELLAPNYRPVQITRDLGSFWKNTYQEVRRDLRARYPKHSWPEDPYTAKPEAKGRRRQ